MNSFEEVIIDLPENPLEAYVVYFYRSFKQLEQARDESFNAEREFVEKLSVFCEVYDLKIFDDFPDPPFPDEPFSVYIAEFLSIARRQALRSPLRIGALSFP